MAITKTIQIDGKDVTFRASAAIPRMYRIRFRRDIYQDMAQLTREVDANDPNKSEIALDNLEMFENIAYLMAKHADPDNVPNTPEDWLEQFNTFSIYTVLPKIIELWGLNTEQQAESKKKFEQLQGK
ncbi:MAG: hypothetical protein UHU21_04540 [Lachnospiraceae bacterium]|nr:hypothetical protein [Lachnospiraceae bacterium]